MPRENERKKNGPKKRKSRRVRGEGSVYYSDSKSCWVWRAVTGRKPDGSVAYTEGRARTRELALQKKQAAERKQTQPHEDKETVGEFLDYWLNSVAKPNVRSNTWTKYESVVRLHLKPRIGGIPLRKLSVSAVTKMWAAMSAEGKGKTVKGCSEVLATAMEVAVAEEKIPVAPTAAATKPKVLRAPVEVFSDDEMKSLIRASAGHRYAALFILAIGTGARQGELFALEDTDFEPADGTVHIRRSLDQSPGGFRVHPPKSASGTRLLSLPEFVLGPLREHAREHGPGPLFTTETGGYIFKSNFVRREWKPLLEKAGVRYRNFHVIRHTVASRLLAAGVDPAEVARRLGDRIETIMRTYAHWINTQGRDTASKLNAIYGGDGPSEPTKAP